MKNIGLEKSLIYITDKLLLKQRQFTDGESEYNEDLHFFE